MSQKKLPRYQRLTPPRVHNDDYATYRGESIGWVGRAENRRGNVFVQYRPKGVKELRKEDGRRTVSFTTGILDYVREQLGAKWLLSIMYTGRVLEYDLAQFDDGWVGGKHPETTEAIVNLYFEDALYEWEYGQIKLTEPINELEKEYEQ